MTRVFLSAGEPSGDRYGGPLADALRARLPAVQIDGIGGPCMRTAGVNLISSADELSTMGLVESARTFPAHLQLLRTVRRRFLAGQYELAILIDYPGFHLRVAASAAKARLPVLYYVAPQLWAWGAWRMNALRRYVESLAVVLPFEERFFRKHGMTAEFVGHPLLDQLTPGAKRSARDALGLDSESPVLGLFPGSRAQETARLWPIFYAAANLVRRSIPNIRIVLAAGLQQSVHADDITVWHGDARTVLLASDAAICKSGTVTLEAALADTPMVIAYRMHPLTFAIARRVVRVPRVGLVNLVAEREVAPEYLQRSATPEALAHSVASLLARDSVSAATQRRAFADVRTRLGSPGAAQRVADMAARLVA